jgi:hypothetical protein
VSNVDDRLDWITIAPMEFSIRGWGESVLKFVANSVLVDNRMRIFTLGLDCEAILEGIRAKVQFSSRFGDYGSLRPFRDELHALLHGDEQSASFDGEWLSFTIGPHRIGVREGLLISGVLTTIPSETAKGSPLPKEEAVRDYVLSNDVDAKSVRFTFQTSTADLKETLTQLNEMVRWLEENGFRFGTFCDD